MNNRQFKKLVKNNKEKKSRLKEYAKANYYKFNYCERRVYHLLKAFFDYDIRCQKVIGNYIVDLYIQELNLIIEIDGEYHNGKEQQKKDIERTKFLMSQGYHIIRFTNEEIKNDLLNVLDKLENEFNNL